MPARRRLFVPRRVAFVHPDLGIGGAERLVVDAAVALKQHGCHVEMFTSHHDPRHCFQETRDGTLTVHVVGDWLPRTVLGGLHLLCAIVRSLVLALVLVTTRERFDVIVCDQLSVSVPLLRLSGAKVLFYCHFPDKLLSAPGGWTKQLYRRPLDWLEEATTRASDLILVNSRFTAGVFAQAFPSIRTPPRVLYPSINFAAYDRVLPLPSDDALRAYNGRQDVRFVLSINRFERKKNIGLAIEAFRQLLDGRRGGALRLVLAGGYDERVAENVEHLRELRVLAESLQLTTATVLVGAAGPGRVADAHVLFLPSFSEAQRSFLLGRAQVLLYTPANEHFGIVPIEAMYAGVPVVAVNNGGPTESIVHEQTGLLVPGQAAAFAAAAGRVLDGAIDGRAMGRRGRERVCQLYSLDKFGSELYAHVDALCNLRG